MVIIIYSMGTLLCLLLLLGLVCLAVGAWQDFTGERRERIELEVRVISQQDKIEELQEHINTVLYTAQRSIAPMNGTIKFYFSDVNGNLESQIRLVLPPYLQRRYGKLQQPSTGQQAYFFCHKVVVNTYGEESDMWAEIMDKISSQFKEWSKLLQRKVGEDG